MYIGPLGLQSVTFECENVAQMQKDQISNDRAVIHHLVQMTFQIYPSKDVLGSVLLGGANESKWQTHIHKCPGN